MFSQNGDSYEAIYAGYICSEDQVIDFKVGYSLGSRFFVCDYGEDAIQDCSKTTELLWPNVLNIQEDVMGFYQMSVMHNLSGMWLLVMLVML